jgi:flagellar motor switch protein FliN/FliY
VAVDLSSDEVIERILVEFAEAAQDERNEKLLLRSFRQTPNPPPVPTGFLARTDGGRTLIIAAFDRPEDAPAAAPKARSAERSSFGQLLNIDLPLSVRLGKARMPIEEVLRLKVGSLVELDRTHDDPVDLIVNGAVVARGDLIAVDGACGLRVREVVRSEGALRIEGI